MKKFYLLFSVFSALINTCLAQWDTIPGGANKPVYALKVYKTGIAIGGEFTTIATLSRDNLAYYEGGTTQAWSYGMLGDFNSSAQFSNVNGTYISSIESFDDHLWIGGKYFHPFYFGYVNLGYMEYDAFSNNYSYKICYSHPNNEVSDLKAFGSKLYAGGYFTNFGGNYFASFNTGDYPSPIPSSVDSGFNSYVQEIQVYNNNLYAAGSFTTAGATSVKGIAKFDGSKWVPLLSGVNGTVYAMAVYNNELVVAGTFTNAGGVTVNNIAKWNGTSWSALGSGLSNTLTTRIYSLKVYNGKLYAGGEFKTSGSTSTENIASWNGSAWSAVGTGITGRVHAMEVFENELWIGGNFTAANGMAAKNIVKYKNSGVGIEESRNDIVSVFPNPANEIISIVNAKGRSMHVVIYNGLGEVVKMSDVHGTSDQLDIRDLQAGIYYLHFETASDRSVTKLIKN